MTVKEDTSAEKDTPKIQPEAEMRRRRWRSSSSYSSRTIRLATPKESKAIWLTSFGLKVLARAKLNHWNPQTFYPEFQYSCGRESQIWPVSPISQHAVVTDRLNFLARHKVPPAAFLEKNTPQIDISCGRSSPIWRPSTAAMTCPIRPRTAQLAIPKALHVDYKPPKQVQSVVSQAAMQCQPSAETKNLAEPKERPDGPFRKAQWKVSQGALQANASPRVVELARPKRLADGYQDSKNVIWKVLVGARNAVTSGRVCDLSKPIIRESMDHVQFKPSAFTVSEAAKKAKASPRIEELAQPIQRGV